MQPRSLIQAELRNPIARDRLVGVARNILKDADESEDAAHDAVVQALSAAGAFRQDARVSTWLHRVAVNAALMRRRKSKRAERKVAASRAEGDALPWLSPTAQTPSAAAMIEQAEQLARLREAIARLPEAYRSVLEHHVYAEESPEVVAQKLGLTPSAVRTRIGRARAQLADLLAA
jgi:RNA polymerase sigma-70 factor (ECF subfamily)